MSGAQPMLINLMLPGGRGAVVGARVEGTKRGIINGEEFFDGSLLKQQSGGSGGGKNCLRKIILNPILTSSQLSSAGTEAKADIGSGRRRASSRRC